jgi:hypothetical protein
MQSSASLGMQVTMYGAHVAESYDSFDTSDRHVPQLLMRVCWVLCALGIYRSRWLANRDCNSPNTSPTKKKTAPRSYSTLFSCEYPQHTSSAVLNQSHTQSLVCHCVLRLRIARGLQLVLSGWRVVSIHHLNRYDFGRYVHLRSSALRTQVYFCGCQG